MAPADEDELADMIATGLAFQGPAFVRYPRGSAVGVEMKNSPSAIEIGKSKRLQSGQDIDIWAVGSMVADAEKLAARLSEHHIEAGVVNARFVKPLDTALLTESAKSTRLIVSMEDQVVTGGLGTAIMEALQEAAIACPVQRIGWPDTFIEHGDSVTKLREENNLSSEKILEIVLARYRQIDVNEGVASEEATA
jgi:1-deoxy-D-xylulose-5-phosphate synthase